MIPTSWAGTPIDPAVLLVYERVTVFAALIKELTVIPGGQNQLVDVAQRMTESPCAAPLTARFTELEFSVVTTPGDTIFPEVNHFSETEWTVNPEKLLFSMLNPDNAPKQATVCEPPITLNLFAIMPEAVTVPAFCIHA